MNSSIVIGSDTLGAEEVQTYLADALGFTSRGGRVFCSYAVLGQQGGRVFLETACEEFVLMADSLESGSARGGPVALTLDTLSQPVRIVGHRVPGDGNRYSRDIREIFPNAVQRQIFARTADHGRQTEDLRRSNREEAARHFAQRSGQTGGPAGDTRDAPMPAAEKGRRMRTVWVAGRAPSSTTAMAVPPMCSAAAVCRQIVSRYCLA